MNGRRWWMGVAVSMFVIAGLAPSVQAGQKVQYALKLTKGLSYDVRMVSDSDMVQQGQGQETRTQVSLGLGYRLQVSAVDSQGNASVDCTVTWVKFRQKSPTAEVGYDSSDKDKPMPPEAQSFGPAGFLGEQFSAQITPQGQVLKMGGLEALRKNMEKKIPDGPARQQVMQGLTDERLAGSIRDYFLRPLAIYPDRPVGIGDSWSRNDSSGIAPYDYENKWTLKDRKAGIVVIDAETTLKQRPQSEQRGTPMSGRARGQIEINESTGQILRSKTIEVMSGQRKIGTSAFDIKTDNVTTFEMTERKAGATP